MKVFASYFYAAKGMRCGVGNSVCEIEANGHTIDEIIRALENDIKIRRRLKKVVLLNFKILED